MPGWDAPREWFRASVVEMRAALDRREVTSRALVDAHLERIAERDRPVCAFTEVFRDEARAIADTRDSELAQGRLRGPLHGIPVTVKECFDFADRASTLGLPSRRGHRASSDAAMILALREAGAVILGRTNLSQLMLTLESDNPLFGRTANPFSTRHSAGGSSGGEAAAIAAGFSPLGVGTDLGGSIRVPAHCCGVVGFKPTPGRLPLRGISGPRPDPTLLPVQAGFLARSVYDVALALDSLAPERMHELDPRVAPIAERPGRPLSELRIGMFSDDGVLSPSAAVIAAVERGADALRAAGATVVPFTPPGLPELFFESVRTLSPLGGSSLLEALGDDPAAESLRPSVQLARLPAAIRRGMAQMSRVTGDSDLARLLDALQESSALALAQSAARAKELTLAIVNVMRERELDLLLCPPYATPAVPHGASAELLVASSYCLVWNAAGFPAGVTPVTRVHAPEARRDRVRGRTGRLARRIDEQSAGLPVGVQVIALPWNDRAVLAALAAIEQNVRSDVDFPRTPVD